jgi:hypothetical protein
MPCMCTASKGSHLQFFYRVLQLIICKATNILTSFAHSTIIYNMSFGFSVGDFIAAAALINNVISALNGAATLEHRELQLELHGLKRALTEIEHLRPSPGQEAAVNAVKVAALMCWYPLEEFHGKLGRYKRLSENRQQKRLDMVKNWSYKLQWNFSMSDEVLKLRAYIAGHVGSLNMRLTTLGLTTMAVAKTEASERDVAIQDNLKHQAALVRDNTAKVEKLYALVAGQLYPQIYKLIELAGKVWASNLQILDHITKFQNNSTKIDVRHTWFQEPIKLEDAFGRLIPIPPEYGWAVRVFFF